MLAVIIIELYVIHNDLNCEYPESDIIKFQSEMIDAQDNFIRTANDIILFKDTSEEKFMEYRQKLEKVDNLWNDDQA